MEVTCLNASQKMEDDITDGISAKGRKWGICKKELQVVFMSFGSLINGIYHLQILS